LAVSEAGEVAGSTILTTQQMQGEDARGDEVEPAVSSSRGAQLVGRKLQPTG